MELELAPDVFLIDQSPMRSTSTTAADAATDQVQKPQPKKRGRGRPPKNVAASPAAADADSVVSDLHAVAAATAAAATTEGVELSPSIPRRASAELADSVISDQ